MTDKEFLYSKGLSSVDPLVPLISPNVLLPIKLLPRVNYI